MYARTHTSGLGMCVPIECHDEAPLAKMNEDDGHSAQRLEESLTASGQ